MSPAKVPTSRPVGEGADATGFCNYLNRDDGYLGVPTGF